MALQLHITFNENSTTAVYDYSLNARDATTVSNLTIANSDRATASKAGVFNGSSTDLNFGSQIDLSGTAAVSIASRVKSTNGTAQIICNIDNQFTLGINASNQVEFTVDAGAASSTATSTGTVPNNTLTSIGATYDGSDITIYIDGAADGTNTRSGNLNGGGNDFHVGTDLTDYLNGELEFLSIYSQALTANNHAAIHNNPGGIKITIDNSNIKNGDIIQLTSKGGAAKNSGVITGDLTSSDYLYIPITTLEVPKIGEIVKHIGNVYDTDRQYTAIFNLSNNSPELLIRDAVVNASPTDYVNNRVEISKTTISQDNKDLLKLALLGN